MAAIEERQDMAALGNKRKQTATQTWVPLPATTTSQKKSSKKSKEEEEAKKWAATVQTVPPAKTTAPEKAPAPMKTATSPATIQPSNVQTSGPKWQTDAAEGRAAALPVSSVVSQTPKQRDDAAIRQHYAETHPEKTGGVPGEVTRRVTEEASRSAIQSDIDTATREKQKVDAQLSTLQRSFIGSGDAPKWHGGMLLEYAALQQRSDRLKQTFSELQDESKNLQNAEQDEKWKADANKSTSSEVIRGLVQSMENRKGLGTAASQSDIQKDLDAVLQEKRAAEKRMADISRSRMGDKTAPRWNDGMAEEYSILQQKLQYLDDFLSKLYIERNQLYTDQSKKKQAEIEARAASPGIKPESAAEFGPDIQRAMGSDAYLVYLDLCNGKRAIQKTDGTNLSNTTVTKSLHPNSSYLSNTQKKTILALADQGDWEGIGSYYKAIERDLNETRQKYKDEKTRQMVREKPLLGIATHVASNFLTPGALVGNAIQAYHNAHTGEYEPTDINSPWFAGNHLYQATNKWVIDYMGAPGEFILSTLDAGAMGLTGLIRPVTDAGKTAYEALDRGAAPEQVLTTSASSFGTSLLTGKLFESPPISNNILQSATSGALQAGANGLIKDSVDRHVLGKNSEYEKNIQKAINSGEDEQEARRTADREFYKKMVKDVAAGALGSILTSRIQQTINSGKEKGASSGRNGTTESGIAALEAAYQSYLADRNIEQLKKQFSEMYERNQALKKLEEEYNKNIGAIQITPVKDRSRFVQVPSEEQLIEWGWYQED